MLAKLYVAALPDADQPLIAVFQRKVQTFTYILYAAGLTFPLRLALCGSSMP
jgi:hypothetical protein